MGPVERAVNLFENGRNCSQAVLTVFGEKFGIDSETAARLGRPWGGGMGHLALTCGALTGAIMVLGLSKAHGDEGEARREAFEAVRELFRRFEEKHGSTVCRELLGADMSTEEGKKKIREEKIVSKVCPGYVRSAAEILAELIS